ncbi:MAG: DUF1636 domain-containing protein [Alphaproteobacteria bacterium]|nr:MAG: DUF1636 domain-containing protein [Alphaproteobacteria bacterium]
MSITPTTLTICLICGMKQRDDQGNKLPNPVSQQLAEDVTALLADTDIKVRLTRCLSMCDTPIAWALQHPRKHTFSFAPATTAEDLAATARAYLATPEGGKLGKKDMPLPVAATLISRIPPTE